MTKMTENSNQISLYMNLTEVQKLDSGLQGLKEQSLKHVATTDNKIMSTCTNTSKLQGHKTRDGQVCHTSVGIIEESQI